MGDFGNTTITYNTITFSNDGTIEPKNTPPYPVPFVTKQVEYVQPETSGGKGRWCRRESITLNGQINDCDEGTIDTKRNNILAAFDEDFHTLEIEGLTNIPLIRVMSVDIGPQEAPNTAVSYSIQLEAYPDDSFALKYRVLDPQDRVDITENEDATATITHTVSCKGINTALPGSASNALTNAKTFVEEKINSGCLRGRLILSKDPNWGKFLISVGENINRITGDYELTKTYTSDLTRLQGGEIVVRHTLDIDDSWGQVTRYVHSGRVEGGRLGSLDAVRTAYKELRESFKDPPVKEPFLVSEQINEDSQNNIINFTITLQKDPPEVIDDYGITVSENSESSLVQISIQGNISATGPLACRLKKVRDYFCGAEDCKASAININNRYKSLCQGVYAEYLADNDINNLPANVVFNSDPLGISVSENPLNATIQYSMQFDNRISYGHHKVSHTMNFTPSLQHISVKELNRPTTCVNQSCPGVDEGGQSSFDLLWMGFRDRSQFAIQGQISVYDPNAQGATMEAMASQKLFSYCDINDDLLLTQKSEAEDQAKNASYNYTWGFHCNKALNFFPATAVINTLRMS